MIINMAVVLPNGGPWALAAWILRDRMPVHVLSHHLPAAVDQFVTRDSRARRPAVCFTPFSFFFPACMKYPSSPSLLLLLLLLSYCPVLNSFKLFSLSFFLSFLSSFKRSNHVNYNWTASQFGLLLWHVKQKHSACKFTLLKSSAGSCFLSFGYWLCCYVLNCLIPLAP